MVQYKCFTNRTSDSNTKKNCNILCYNIMHIYAMQFLSQTVLYIHTVLLITTKANYNLDFGLDSNLMA